MIFFCFINFLLLKAFHTFRQFFKAKFVFDFMMKKLLILVCIIFTTTFSYGQRESDLGFAGGAAYYMGDINPNTPFYSPNLNLGIIYRYNFNKHYILKFEANYLNLSGDDLDFDNTFQQSRGENFNNTLTDLSLQFEFNFLPLNFDVRKIGFTPFVSSGLAYGISIGSVGGFAVPFAMGTKFSFGKNWTFGLVWNFRKTFTDELDEVKNGVFDTDLIGNERSAFNNNDWYSFANVFITYKIFDFRTDCPAYMKEK